jgi:hypothetical protein
MNHPPDRISGGSFSCRLGIHREAPIKGRPYFFGIKKCSMSDFLECEESLRLPFTEGPEPRTGCFAGEYDFDAILCAD